MDELDDFENTWTAHLEGLLNAIHHADISLRALEAHVRDEHLYRHDLVDRLSRARSALEALRRRTIIVGRSEPPR